MIDFAQNECIKTFSPRKIEKLNFFEIPKLA